MDETLTPKELASLYVIAKGISAIRIPAGHIHSLLRLNLVERDGGLSLTSMGWDLVKLRPRYKPALAKRIVDIATGEVEDGEPKPEEQGKDPAAVALGRKSGRRHISTS